MSELVVCAYNVGFGDAILVTFPDRNPRTGKETARNILIDVGNLAAGTGSGHRVFKDVVNDILKRLGGRNIDLYVMTHEHYDHVTGLYDAFDRYGLRINIDYSWLTASSDPEYYARHPAARRRKELIEAHYKSITGHLAAVQDPRAKGLQNLMANNDPIRTRTRVQFLQKDGRASKRTTYVHAEKRLYKGTHHPFEEAKLKVLAPEEDTTCYPVGLQPLPLTIAPLPIGPAGDGDTDGHSVPLQPPDGVDPKAFARLLERRKHGMATDVMAIDKAANNTSVVFILEWRGWRLLFAGDAEEASWAMMEKMKRLLKPVHFLKVAHHGSINGTPDDSILNAVQPTKPHDSRKRIALVSTCPGTNFGNVPHQPTLNRLRERCDLVRATTEVPRGKAVEISFEG